LFVVIQMADKATKSRGLKFNLCLFVHSNSE
jgi:hypothetical protein